MNLNWTHNHRGGGRGGDGRLQRLSTVGTISNDDDDGSVNVAEKMNLRSFKLNLVYLDPLNMSNAGDFSWSWILKDFIQVQKGEGKFVVVCRRPQLNVQLGGLTS